MLDTEVTADEVSTKLESLRQISSSVLRPLEDLVFELREVVRLGVEEGKKLVPNLDLSGHELDKLSRLGSDVSDPLRPSDFGSGLRYAIALDPQKHGDGSVWGIAQTLAEDTKDSVPRTTLQDNLTVLWETGKIYRYTAKMGGKGRPITFWGLL